MIDEKVRNAILFEIHKSVDEVSSRIVEHLSCEDLLYPPNENLLPEEQQAIANLELSLNAKSGLRKVIASACITPIFHLFCLLDGVADPPNQKESEPWLGLTLEPNTKEDAPFLHDELYESYWAYKRWKDCRPLPPSPAPNPPPPKCLPPKNT